MSFGRPFTHKSGQSCGMPPSYQMHQSRGTTDIVSNAATLAVLCLGVLVLAGWAGDIEALKRVSPDFPTMNPLTAALFVASACSLWFVGAKNPRHRLWSMGLAVLILTTSILNLAADLGALYAEPDHILFWEAVESTTPPSEMAPSTSVGFLVAALALTFLHSTEPKRRGVGQYFAFALACVAMFAAIGYIYGAQTGHSLKPFNLMAVHTSLGLLLLAIGLLFKRPESGWMSLVVSNSPASRLLRVKIPAAIVVPIFLGWLCIRWVEAGYFGQLMALTLLASVSVLIFIIMMFATTWLIQETEKERQRQAEILQISEARISGIVSIAADAIISVDSHRRITLFNAWAEKIFGYTSSEVLGQRLEILLPERFRGNHAAHVEAFGAGPVEARRMGDRQEIFALRKDGSEFPADATISKLSLNGEAIYTVVLRDMTDRWRAAAALQESEERFRTLANNISQFAWMADKTGYIFWYNQRWFEYTGTTLEEMKGWGWKNVHHPDHVERVVEKIAQCFKSGEPWEDSFPLRAKDGTYRRFLSRAIPIRDAKGTVLRWFGTNTDTEALLLAKGEAEAAANSKSEFLANMSHEIRTPLNSISGFTQLLLEHNNLEGESLARVKKIGGATSALTTLVDDILDYAKLEEGKISLSVGPFSPSQLIDHCVSMMSSNADRKDVAICVVASPEIKKRFYIGDARRVQQVLLNLLSNAIKFTREGVVTITIEEEAPQGELVQVRMSVADTGIGIAPDRVGLLFKRFSQVDSSVSRKFGGTGLGLAICQRLVTLMGGEIGLESEPGKGSTFFFRLPMNIAAVPERGSEDVERSHSAAINRSILLVEDMELNQEIAVAMLEGAGHRVDVAGDGAEAVRMVANKRYDLVLMDIQMPVMDGIAATEKIRAMASDNGAIPIIAMTANVLPEEVARFRAAGMNGHIGKPVDLGDLVAEVDRWTIESTKAAA